MAPTSGCLRLSRATPTRSRRSTGACRDPASPVAAHSRPSPPRSRASPPQARAPPRSRTRSGPTPTRPGSRGRSKGAATSARGSQRPAASLSTRPPTASTPRSTTPRPRAPAGAPPRASPHVRRSSPARWVTSRRVPSSVGSRSPPPRGPSCVTPAGGSCRSVSATRGFFVSTVPVNEDPARATLVVRDAAGAAIARRRLAR